MKAIELIGKKAVRTVPTVHGDYSYSTTPIEIIKVTNGHIMYKAVGEFQKKLIGEDVHILNSSYLDNNWIDYDELLTINN